MNLPTEFFILAALLAGFALGYLAAAIPARRLVRRVSLESWRSAAIFYTRRNSNS